MSLKKDVHIQLSLTALNVFSSFHDKDSIVARRWINGMVMSLLEYEDDGSLIQVDIIKPLRAIT